MTSLFMAAGGLCLLLDYLYLAMLFNSIAFMLYMRNLRIERRKRLDNL